MTKEVIYVKTASIITKGEEVIEKETRKGIEKTVRKEIGKEIVTGVSIESEAKGIKEDVHQVCRCLMMTKKAPPNSANCPPT